MGWKPRSAGSRGRRVVRGVWGVCAPLWLATTLLACGDDDRRISDRGRPGADLGADGSTADFGAFDFGPTQDLGPPTDNCSDAARWVYLVDSGRQLVRFQPDDLSLTPIGTLSCPGDSTPFSMSVDREARAWVLHQNGQIYHVSTSDASCTESGFAPNQSGFELFGMGFVSDDDGGDDETLFVSGGARDDVTLGSARLGSIDDQTLALTASGSLPGWPELTGTGSGQLWGFFPDTSPPSVRRLAKATGSTEESFDLSALRRTVPMAWAFAFWGGRFYIFFQDALDPSTSVWRLDPTSGAVEEVLHHIGYRIVGAGVSTCAPVEIF